MVDEGSKEFLLNLVEKVDCLASQMIKRAERIDIEYDVGNIDSLFKEGGAYILIAKTFLYSAIDDFRATFILLKDRLFNVAFMALRRLFELAVDLQFIGKSLELHSKQYLLFEDIQAEKIIEYMSKYWPNIISDKERVEKKKSILKNAEKAKIILGYDKKKKPPKDWSYCNLADKCKEIGWEKQYDLVYRLCCIYAHPSPRGFGSFLKQLPDGGFEYVKPVFFYDIIIPHTIRIFLYILEDANRILNTGLDEEINEIRREIIASKLS
jgi:hypothetical protein